MRTQQFDQIETQPVRALCRGRMGVAIRAMPVSSSASGAGQLMSNGMADGAAVVHAPVPGGSGPPPSHGSLAEPLRPAWAS
jgi:hypothetical protein